MKSYFLDMMNAHIRSLFRDKVKALGGSRATAEALGCSRSFVDMLITGDRRPGMRTARAIEELFGIPMQAWVERPAHLSAARHTAAQPAARPTLR